MNGRIISRRQVIGLTVSLMTTLTYASPLNFPQQKAIKIILPFSAGGGTDESSRTLGDELQKILGVPVVAENKPGASGSIAVNALMAAPADGHTLLIATNSLVSVNPVTIKNLGYDPFKDLTPVHGITVSPPIISAPLNWPYKNLKDALLEYKKEGKALKIGNYSHGYELLGAWLGQLEGTEVIPVPYKGPSNMLIDLVGGRLDLAISDPTSAQELIKTGKIRGVGSGASKRDASMPDVPTMKELGYPEFESYVWASVYAKAGTPPDILKALADALGQANRTPAMGIKRTGRPGEALNLALDEMGKFQKTEFERFKKIAETTKFVPK